MTRLLGIDLGERRVGIAVGDSESGLAQPLATLRRAASIEADAAGLARLVAEQHADELVVGLPLEAAGHEGTMAAAARAWAEAVGAMLGLPITLRDERLTSHLAEERLGRPKRGRSGGPPTPAQREAHRQRIDREAAAIMLQDELDARTKTEATR